MEKNALMNVLGISCIENYALGILKEEGNDITRLYCRSFVNPQKLQDDVFLRNITYENYMEIPRVQTIAKNLGLIEIHTSSCESFSQLLKTLHSKATNEHVLIKVKPRFMQEHFKTKTWRSDHYMLIYVSGSGFRFVNDVPISEGGFSEAELKNVYDETVCVLTVLRKMEKHDVDLCMADFIDDFHRSCLLLESSGNANFLDNDLIKFKNFVLLYKTFLSRVIEFAEPYFDLSTFNQSVDDFNRILAKTEYSILRNRNYSLRDGLQYAYSTWVRLNKTIRQYLS